MEENNNLEQKEGTEITAVEDTPIVEDISQETLSSKNEERKSENEVIDNTSTVNEISADNPSSKNEEKTVTESSETEVKTVTPIVAKDSSENSNESADSNEVIEKAESGTTEHLSSTKPQAVLDELDKLKTASHEAISSGTISDSAASTTTEVTSIANISVVTNDSSFTSCETSFENKEEIVSTSNTLIDDTNVTLATDSTSSEEKAEEDNKDTEENESSAQTESIVVKSEAETVEVISESKDGSISPQDNSINKFSFKRYFNADFWKSFVFDTLFLIFCFFLTFVIVQKWFSSQEAKIYGMNQVHASLESGEKTTIGNINVLVMGIDSVEGTHRSDTIFVLGVNPSKAKITMLSIPRDTRVIIENKARKINEVLPRYGEPTLRMILEDLLKIKISRKVEVGFESFIEVVDAIGGVDINIEKAMNYDDNWGNLHIHFKPGMNHLDGQDALRYVRFRKDAMADLGRIKRQQDFVKAIVKKIMSPTSIVKLPNIIEKAFKHIKTDFTIQEVLTLAKGFNTTDVKIRTMSLPGVAEYVDKISYFMPYSEEAISIGNNYFSDLAIFEIEKNYEVGRVIPASSKPVRKNK